MNLLFRLALLCSTFLFDRRRIDTFGAAELDFRVWPFDLDLNLHMNNGRYLSLMDLGRLELMMRLGLLGAVLKNKWMPVLASAQIRYRVPLQPFEKFRLQTRVIYWDDKWFYMEQRFLVTRGRDKNVVAAIGFVKGSFYDRKAKQTVPSSVIEGLLGITPSEKPAMPDIVKSWQAAEDDMRALTTKENTR